MTPSGECPNCGAAVRRGRLACPECGSDAETGWREAEDIDYLSVDLPDAWGEPEESRSQSGTAGWRRLVAFVLLLALAAAIPLLFRRS
ncbi:MAG: hypothetical protein AAF628_33550 [Planctomycetota bacterium]